MVGTIKDTIRDMNNGILDFTDNGRCRGCGECCSNILPMTMEDVARIKKYIAKHDIKEQKAPAVLANPKFNLYCPFMRMDVAKDRCTIYPVRPEICREFKCDKARKGEQYSGKNTDFMVVEMRETFYGGGKT